MIFRLPRLDWVYFLLAICLPLGAAAPKEDEVRKVERSDALKRDYVLQAEDRIRVSIFQEPDLSTEVRVLQEGTVTLALLHTIEVSGKSVRQAEDYIQQLYAKDYLVDPQVT